MKKLMLLAVVLSMTGGWGKNLYVRPNSYGSGANNGRDWTNAFRGLHDGVWNAAAAGDFIYVAGGSYGAWTVKKSGSISGGPITVKRATADDPACTGSAGWTGSLDAQVQILNQFCCISTLGYNSITIDGVVPNGIKVSSSQTNDTRVIQVGFGREYGSSYITLRHIEVQGVGENSPLECTGIYAASSGVTERDLRFEYLNMYGMSTFIKLHSLDGVVIQHCRFKDGHTSGSAHTNVVWAQAAKNVVYRYNQAYNYAVEGVFTRSDCSAWEVYASVFKGDGYGVATKTGYTISGIKVYNCTFHKINLAIRLDGSGIDAKNNLFYGCKAGTQGGLVASADPFVNASAHDYHLKASAAARDAGQALAAAYQTDLDGNTFGADGKWDVGAYEFTQTGILLPHADLQFANYPALPHLIHNYQLPNQDCQILNILGQPVRQANRAGTYLIRTGNGAGLQKLTIVP